MRLFLAIELPEQIREHLHALQEIFAGELKAASFTRPENLHLTLKFLGEADEKIVPPLCESLNRVRSSGEMRLRCEAVECLPPRGPIRVIGTSIGGDVAQLRSLHESIEQRCKFLGYAQETRQFRPHVTLARARGVLPSSVRSQLIEMSSSHLSGDAFVAREFVLFQSRLHPKGSQYVPLARFPLAVETA